VREVAQLMRELGFPDEAASAFKENAITGGDVLQLGDEELSGDLGLSRLQVEWSSYRQPWCSDTLDVAMCMEASRSSQAQAQRQH